MSLAFIKCAQVTVGGAIADPAAASEPDVTGYRHPALEYSGHCHKLIALRVGTTQTLTGEGRLTTELLGQLAFTPSETGVIKHGPFLSAVVIPNTRPTSAYLWHYPEPWLLGASYPLRHPAGCLLGLSREPSAGYSVP